MWGRTYSHIAKLNIGIFFWEFVMKSNFFSKSFFFVNNFVIQNFKSQNKKKFAFEAEKTWHPSLMKFFLHQIFSYFLITSTSVERAENFNLSFLVFREMCKKHSFWVFRCQFHQHFTWAFCANIFVPKNYKVKM